jgi:uncharacterized integral membrane protein
MWSESWAQKFNSGKTRFMYFLITATVLIYLSVVVLIVISFLEFSFTTAKWILGINIILYIVVTGITVSGWN